MTREEETGDWSGQVTTPVAITNDSVPDRRREGHSDDLDFAAPLPEIEFADWLRDNRPAKLDHHLDNLLSEPLHRRKMEIRGQWLGFCLAVLVLGVAIYAIATKSFLTAMVIFGIGSFTAAMTTLIRALSSHDRERPIRFSHSRQSVTETMGNHGNDSPGT